MTFPPRSWRDVSSAASAVTASISVLAVKT